MRLSGNRGDIVSDPNAENRVSLQVRVGDLKLRNPLIAASGTVGFGHELLRYITAEDLGGIVGKAVTLLPRAGNPPPRLAETPAGMLNAIGLQNPGLQVFLDRELPHMLTYDTAVIANVAGSTAEDYLTVCRALADSGLMAVELNLSCPNVDAGRLPFGTDPHVVEKLTRAAKAALGDIPLWVKLTPNVTDIAILAQAAEAGGADAVSAINTLRGMMIDIRTRRPVLRNNTGGLSGPAILPVALCMVQQIYQAIKIPVIGGGGIRTAEDVLAFMIAGASAVQIGTATLLNPTAIRRIRLELEEYMLENGLTDLNDLVGSLELWN
ncbi:MAG: dihydroorotate dehydrogenase [Clostridiaceae bacterium]|nr:dihydroorotate dehydrogenase [Clostridiaceae bacterium]